VLRGDGNRAIGAANDRTFVTEGVGAAEVDNEAGILGIAHKSDGSANFNAKGFVGLGIGNARGRGGIGAPAAPDVDGAGRGGGTARVRCDTNTRGIGSRAYVVLNFLLGILAGHETS